MNTTAPDLPGVEDYGLLEFAAVGALVTFTVHLVVRMLRKCCHRRTPEDSPSDSLSSDTSTDAEKPDAKPTPAPQPKRVQSTRQFEVPLV